jgi:hypothetical protein
MASSLFATAFDDVAPPRDVPTLVGDVIRKRVLAIRGASHERRDHTARVNRCKCRQLGHHDLLYERLRRFIKFDVDPTSQGEDY